MSQKKKRNKKKQKDLKAVVGRVNDLHDLNPKNVPIELAFKEIGSGKHSVGKDFLADPDGDKTLTLAAATERARELRAKGNLEGYAVVKAGVPAYAFQCTLKSRSTVKKLSGRIVLDFDKLNKPLPEVLEQLRAFACVEAIYTTFSGERVLALVCVDETLTEANFKHVWFAVARFFSAYGDADDAYRVPTQLASPAYDFHYYHNPKVVPHSPNIEAVAAAYESLYAERDAVEERALGDLPEEYRDAFQSAVAEMEWKADGWGVSSVPCPFTEHEHDGWDLRTNRCGVRRHEDEKGYTLHCFKCQTRKSYRVVPSSEIPEGTVRLKAFHPAINPETGRTRRVLQPRERYLVGRECAEVIRTSGIELLRLASVVGTVEDGKFVILEIPKLQGILSEHVRLQTRSKTDWVAVDNPPRWIAEDILLNRAEDFEEIKVIVQHPWWDGERILYSRGIHKGVYLLNDFEECQETLDADGTLADPAEMLKSLIQDYPLANAGDIENTIAMFLTPYVRQALGMSPLFFITSPRPNLGKSSIADITGFLAQGSRPTVRDLGYSKQEIIKAMDASFLDSPELLVFDNVAEGKEIDSAYLASVTTQPMRSFRRLGVSKQVAVENRATFLYTGTGIAATSELVSRAVVILLDDDGSHLENREWKKKNIIEKYLPEHFPKYQNALLLMIQRWIDAGMPAGTQRHRALEWAETIGGILQVNGLGEHFLSNEVRSRQQTSTISNDENNAIYEAAVELELHNVSVGESVDFTVQEVFLIFSYEEHTDRDGRHTVGMDLLGHLWADYLSNSRARAIKLGRWLSKNDGRAFECGVKLVKRNQSRQGRSIYKFVKLNGFVLRDEVEPSEDSETDSVLDGISL